MKIKLYFDEEQLKNSYEDSKVILGPYLGSVLLSRRFILFLNKKSLLKEFANTLELPKHKEAIHSFITISKMINEQIGGDF